MELETVTAMCPCGTIVTCTGSQIYNATESLQLVDPDLKLLFEHPSVEFNMGTPAKTLRRSKVIIILGVGVYCIESSVFLCGNVLALAVGLDSWWILF